MTREDALTQLVTMFAGAPSGVTPEAHFDDALAQATIVDHAGRVPTDPNWTPTCDVWLAAAAVADALHVQTMIAGAGTGGLESFTSEGATFRFGEAATWADVAAWFRRRSPLYPAGTARWLDVSTGAPEQHFRSEATHRAGAHDVRLRRLW